MNFAQFTIQSYDSSSQNLVFQRFINVWTRVTNFNEVMERRKDNDSYFEVEGNGKLVIETFFTEDESVLLMEQFPDEFSILVYS